jgi:hypothetical protein
MSSKAIQRSLTALLLLVAAACGGQPDADASREIELPPAAADSTLGDAAATPPAQPAAPAPAPVTKAPAPAPTRPAAARSGVIAAGTALPLAAGARICTNTHAVGDRFTAVTSADVAGSNGAVIPAGSEVTLEVVESARGENSQDKVKLSFRPVSITVRGTAMDLTADVTQVARLEFVRVQSTGTQAGKVAAGAAVGAVAGQLLGRDTKSTVAGAAVGAVAGGAVAAATTDYNGCLAANGAITVALREDLRIRVG